MDLNYVDGAQIVQYFLILVGLAYVAFEVFLNLNDIKDDTTNFFLLKWSKGNYIFIPFALGAIGGHLFLGTKLDLVDGSLIKGIDNSYLAVYVLFFLCGLFAVVGFASKFSRSKTFLTIMLVLGFLYGHYCWSLQS